MKRPAFQFYPADWRKDVELQSCSMAAQGLWINVMCLAHECEPYGHLTINGKAMTPAQLGRQVGLSAKECEALLVELEDAGVARKSEAGVFYSSRMVRDEDLRNRRAAGGKDGAEHGIKGAEAGSKGGRPKSSKGGSETPLHEDSNPPPSSSTSSSTSVSPSSLRSDGEASQAPPATPAPSRKREQVTLSAYLALCKAGGKKPVPDDHSIRSWAHDAGITDEMLQVAWVVFRERYTTDEKAKGKRYKDWPGVFANAVKDRWQKLWFIADDNTVQWTSTGLQRKQVLDAHLNRNQEAQHAGA